MEHLAREGLAERAINVGDVMTDVCFRTRDAVPDRPPALPDRIDPDRPYLVATIHRADNTDDADRLRSVINVLRDLDAPVVLVAHPRLVSRVSAFGVELGGGSVVAVAPLGYADMVHAVLRSAGVVTDSGGLQKQAFLLGAPCTTPELLTWAGPETATPS